MAKTTLQTIADELGVSRTTVSNAFSRPDQLSEELRGRILEAASRLGYTGPHPAARTLRRGRAGVLGVVLKESLAYAFADPYALRFLGGMAAETEPARLGLLLIPCPPGTEADAVRAAVVDGFCVFSLPHRHPVVEAVVGRHLPNVFVDGPRLEGHAFVGIDNRQAMADITRHVVELGHRRVVVLTFRVVGDQRVGPVDAKRLKKAEYRITAERLTGALDTLRSAGIEPLIYEVGLNARETARQAAEEILGGAEPPTAILCLSDQIALGALDAASLLGIEVPTQLSVTGFDDIAEAEPAGITTIRQPAEAKGRLAAQLLQFGENREVILSHSLVVRATTGSVRS